MLYSGIVFALSCGGVCGFVVICDPYLMSEERYLRRVLFDLKSAL